MPNADRFKYDYNSIETLYKENEAIKTALADSYSQSQAFFDSMINTDLWKGEAKDAFMAFYHLVLQYHAWVNGSAMPSYLDSAPCTTVDFDCQAELGQALLRLKASLNEYSGSSWMYKGLEGISE